MSTESERPAPKFVENSLLVAAGVVAHAPLWYQLPRWTKGLDPTFVHPSWIERSPFPLVLYMSEIQPVIWMAIMVVIFIRICRNYGWRLERRFSHTC
jgi:hypothetical protein